MAEPAAVLCKNNKIVILALIPIQTLTLMLTQTQNPTQTLMISSKNKKE